MDAIIMVGITNNERRSVKNPKAMVRYVFFSNINLLDLKGQYTNKHIHLAAIL